MKYLKRPFALTSTATQSLVATIRFNIRGDLHCVRCSHFGTSLLQVASCNAMADRRVRRALASDINQRGQTLRRLLASTRLSQSTLLGVLEIVRQQPDIVDSNIGDLEAAYHGMFETMRIRVPIKQEEL